MSDGEAPGEPMILHDRTGLLAQVRYALTDAGRAVQSTRLLAPVIRKYQVAFDKIERLRASSGEEGAAFHAGRERILEAAHVEAAPLLAAVVGEMGCTYLKLAQYVRRSQNLSIYLAQI